MEAELLQTLDRGDEAVAILRGAIAKFPDAKEIVQRLAALHADLGDPGEATRLYWKLYEDESEPAMRLRRVADLHGIASFEGTVGDLLGSFEERRRSNPGSPDPLLAIAEIHRLEEDWPAREQALLSASRLREDDLALRLAIADAQLEQKMVKRRSPLWNRPPASTGPRGRSSASHGSISNREIRPKAMRS
jgi:hypothetical protein